MQANHSYGGKPYSLEQTLLRSASYWATRVVKSKKVLAWDRDADSMAEVGNPFFPSRDDLIQEVWARLLQARTKLDEVWADPHPVSGGFRGVCKFVSRVVTNAAIDAKRRNDVRAPEILAVSLDEPFSVTDSYEGTTEDSGTLADTISDEIALPQAFRLEDLQSEMSAEEFDVLYESFANNATIRELAEEQGNTRAEVGRIAASAKGKARKWIEWLRRAPEKQVRAHISLTFEKKPCLRPDKISKSALENWHEGIPVVQFHDESGEWRPRITKQIRVRATRECWNGACTNGRAIGPDNLVLPAARRNETVRFMPAYTGRDNRLCAGCETATPTKISSDEATRTVGQIGPTKPHVWAIPTRDDLIADAKQDQPHRDSYFLGKRNSQHLEEQMQYQEAAEKIKQHDIPRSTIARLSGLYLSDLSGWLNGRTDLAQDKIERVSTAVADISKMVEAMKTLSIGVDLTDCDNVRRLVQKINDAEMQMDLALDPPDLRMTDIEPTSGTAFEVVSTPKGLAAANVQPTD